MSSRATAVVLQRIRERGPITVAEFMELALYHPDAGYYCTAPRRSGRSGDFFTSVDLGPAFGDAIAEQVAEIDGALGGGPLHIVDAGASDGRLAKDLLDALAREHPALYERVRLTAVERSACARAAHAATLAPHAGRVASSADLPAGGVHVIVANELLDAMPAHVIVRTPEGPREVFVSEDDGRLVETLRPISDPAVARRLDDDGLQPGPGARLEISLQADQWIERAAAAIERGVIVLFDYFRDGRHAALHPRGTLATYRDHVADGGSYLSDVGQVDVTAHVDLPAVRRAAARSGLSEIGAVDQTYFLAGLEFARRLATGGSPADVRRRLAAKTLWLPGGLGSTMKAVAFSKGLGAVSLRGFAAGRLT
jgi:SAM-dependent MidA family methyltransferase